MIRFACPKCHTAFRVSGDRAGKRCTCPVCGQRLRVPGRKRRAGPPRRRAEAGGRGTGAGLLPYLLAACLLAALVAVGAAAGGALAHPAAGLAGAVLPADKPSPPGDQVTRAADSATDGDSPDPELFETPPRNYRSLPAAQQARLQGKYEPLYLDPTAADAQHIAAANVLLGLPRGYTSLLKGLDVYEGRPDLRRRYRWCLQYLCIAQENRDLFAPAQGGESAGIIPARHVAALLERIRDIDPEKRPERAGQFSTALAYLGQHGDAAPVLPTLRGMHDRLAGGNGAAAREVQDTIRALEQRR